MIFLSAEDTQKVFDWRSAMDCVIAAYIADIEPSSSPGRIMASAAERSMRCMPAMTPGGRYMGTKHLVKARGGQITFLIVLFDQDDGSLAYMIDAVHITALRTAATSAAALSLLRGPSALELAVLGSSMEARVHVEALSSMFEIASLSVFSPSEENRTAFGRRFAAELGIPVTVADSAPAAVVGATHVLAAARSHGEQPILYADWLAPEAIVLSIVSVIERAATLSADDAHELVEETGDMIEASSRGVAFESKLFSLQQLARGELASRLEPRPDLLLFKSLGSGRQDIAVAEMVATRCAAAGLGTDLPAALSTKESVH
jgi:ornithine cyclodeaminase/alanine dehydrogenase